MAQRPSSCLHMRAHVCTSWGALHARLLLPGPGQPCTGAQLVAASTSTHLKQLLLLPLHSYVACAAQAAGHLQESTERRAGALLFLCALPAGASSWCWWCSCCRHSGKLSLRTPCKSQVDSANGCKCRNQRQLQGWAAWQMNRRTVCHQGPRF